MKEIDYAVKYYESVTGKEPLSIVEKERLYWTYRNFIKDEIRAGRTFNKKLLSDMVELHNIDFKESVKRLSLE